MTEKEEQIYKSGKENPNAYNFRKNRVTSFLNRRFKKKCFLFYSIVIVIFVIVNCSLLVFNIVSYGTLYSFYNASDGLMKMDSNFAVYFLDVGQGDCSIVICDDSVMIIDTSTVNHKKEILNALIALNINEVDYLVVTHQHDDHMGNAELIIEKCTVKNIIMPKISDSHDADTIAYKSLLKSIVDNNVNPIASIDLDSFQLGSAKVDILSPTKSFKDLNNMSIVLKISYGDNSFLFQGDAEKSVENNLIKEGIDVSADLLKVGHHGSNTSTTEAYLSSVNPQVAIISYGSGNNFNHPNHNVIDRLEECNIDTYLTLYHGNITVTSDGNEISVYYDENKKCETYT